MTSTGPPSNALGRRQHDFLVSHGYEFLGLRGGGHYAYEHPKHGKRFVSGTGYDAKGWAAFKSDMRRLFPGAFKERKSARPTRPAKQMSPAESLVAYAAERGWTLTLSQAHRLVKRCGSVGVAFDAVLAQKGEVQVVVPDEAKPKRHYGPKKAPPAPRQPWEPIQRKAA